MTAKKSTAVKVNVQEAVETLQKELQELKTTYQSRVNQIEDALNNLCPDAVIGRKVYYRANTGKLASIVITQRNVNNFSVSFDGDVYTVDYYIYKGRRLDVYEDIEVFKDEMLERLENKLSDLDDEISSQQEDRGYSERNIKECDKEISRLGKERAKVQEEINKLKNLSV